MSIVSVRDGEITASWTATRLDTLGKSEEYFEAALAADVGLMGLDSESSSVRGPFRVFRQLQLRTPAGRDVYPDIVILTGSADVVIVEVKRYVNRELRDRDVIAQILDYAGGIANLDNHGLVEMLNRMGVPGNSWPDVVESLFPESTNPTLLAETFLARMRAGQVKLIVACDRVPASLPTIVRSLIDAGRGQLFNFEFEVMEIVPHVQEGAPDDILFVPSTRLTTEVVARTQVTVTFTGGTTPPSVTVETSPLDEVVTRTMGTNSGPRPRLTDEDLILQIEASTPDGSPAASVALSLVEQLPKQGFLLERNPTSLGVKLENPAGKGRFSLAVLTQGDSLYAYHEWLFDQVLKHTGDEPTASKIVEEHAELFDRFGARKTGEREVGSVIVPNNSVLTYGNLLGREHEFVSGLVSICDQILAAVRQ